MLVRVNINNLNCNSRNENRNIGFQGLSRHLSRNFVIGGKSKKTGFINFAEDTVIEAVETYPKARRFVGNLPPEWIDRIPKEKRRETVRQILGLDTRIEFIKSGEIGKAFKLEVGEKQYVLKTFHSDMDPYYNKWHGKILEPSRAFYTRKKGCKTFTDYYFGKIGTNESKDAFMVTKFQIKEQKLTPAEETKRLLRILKSPVTTCEIDIGYHPGAYIDINSIGLKIIDFGNLEMIPQKLNKELRKVAKSVEKYCFNTKKSWNKEDAVLNQIKNAADLFKNYCIHGSIKSNLENVLTRLATIVQEM